MDTHFRTLRRSSVFGLLALSNSNSNWRGAPLPLSRSCVSSDSTTSLAPRSVAREVLLVQATNANAKVIFIIVKDVLIGIVLMSRALTYNLHAHRRQKCVSRLDRDSRCDDHSFEQYDLYSSTSTCIHTFICIHTPECSVLLYGSHTCCGFL